ncbi:MAG TPA: 50S ribosomal protein L29 [Bacteroidia bacterium]|nr:50S ribosomal protein L29 [Bacteroidia bacterium]HNT80238.1 50S ribosomal protein L29 [Bacteroidia bacterium]
MKQKNIVKELSTNELVDRISEEKANLSKLQLNHAVSPIENPAKIKTVRRLVAQLKTELTQRQKNKN